MLKKILPLLAIALLLWGCTKETLDFSIRYKEIQGLAKGDRVVFEENHVGDVTGVSYTDRGDYLVSVTLGADFKNAATEHARFFVVDDSGKAGKKAVEIILTGKGGSPLANGAVVEGSTRVSTLMDQVKKGFDRGMEDFRTGFNKFMEDMKALPESEQFNELEKEIGRLEEELKRSGEAAREKLRDEVLPQIRENVEKLREWLKSMEREDELNHLEEKIDDLTTI